MTYGLNEESYLDVIGLDKRHDVLVYTVRSMSQAIERSRNLSFARKTSDIKRRHNDGDMYDRVIVGDDVVMDMSVEALKNLARMNRGLMCLFVPSAEVEASLVERLGELYPHAEVAGFDSSVGRVVVCDAYGEAFEAGRHDTAFPIGSH